MFPSGPTRVSPSPNSPTPLFHKSFWYFITSLDVILSEFPYWFTCWMIQLIIIFRLDIVLTECRLQTISQDTTSYIWYWTSFILILMRLDLGKYFRYIMNNTKDCPFDDALHLATLYWTLICRKRNSYSIYSSEYYCIRYIPKFLSCRNDGWPATHSNPNPFISPLHTRNLSTVHVFCSWSPRDTE